MARDVQITFDCADPAGLAAFWAEALGYHLQDPPEGFESWEQALEAMGVPPESRNDASAVLDPDGSRPRRFLTCLRSGTRWKNSRGREPSGSSTAEASLRLSGGTPIASRACSHDSKPSGGSCR